MKNYFKKIISFFILSFVFAFLLLPNISLAEEEGDIFMDGLDRTAQGVYATGDQVSSPQIIIARIIRITLGFLGTIFVALIVYGGFVWMTSRGNQEKVGEAKKTIINATIGVAVVMSAFAIAEFVIANFVEISQK